MPITITPTPEGDALRLAIRHLPPHLEADPAVEDFLTHFAADLDAAEAKRRHDAVAAANRDALTRAGGHWVRRAQGNGGPGIPGTGHVAHPWKAATATDRYAIALCGKTLVGALEWDAGPVATADNRRQPHGWSTCRDCARDLRTTVRRVA